MNEIHHRVAQSPTEIDWLRSICFQTKRTDEQIKE